jgi:hypothetical protein
MKFLIYVMLLAVVSCSQERKCEVSFVRANGKSTFEIVEGKKRDILVAGDLDMNDVILQGKLLLKDETVTFSMERPVEKNYTFKLDDETGVSLEDAGVKVNVMARSAD